MFPEPMKELPEKYDDEQDEIDGLKLYVKYLACLLNSGATAGSPEASACFEAYCTSFDDRFPV